MDLQPFIAQAMAERPDLIGDSRRVSLVVQRVARRVCRDTRLLRMELNLTPDATQIVAGAWGDCVFAPGALPGDPALGWEPKINLEILQWKRVALRKAGDSTVPPVILKPKMDLDYQDYLLRLGHGGALTEGTPEVFNDRMGVLFLAPAWDLLTFDQLVASVTVAPAMDAAFTRLPGLPAEAENALMSMILADVLDLSGRGQNPGKAQAERIRGLNHCSALKSMNLLGQSGDLDGRMSANPFNFQVK